MAVTRAHRTAGRPDTISSKKPASLVLGSRITHFMVKNIDRRFAVHQDLICKSSRLFKTKLQEKRKEIDGDCVICQETLAPQVSDITFCKAGCGQNIHEKCFKRWSAIQSICPMCRVAWEDSHEQLIEVNVSLNQHAVDLYIKWLYALGAITLLDSLPESTSAAADRSTLHGLLSLHTVALEFQDTQFATEVLRTFLQHWKQEAKRISLAPLMRDVYEDKLIREYSRRFLVQAYLTVIEPGWFDGATEAFPSQFVADVGNALIVNRGVVPTETLMLLWYKRKGR
ncbi:hypothetical protein CC80DRAFT_242825 [Byssothecium circinans]|uniref:RING-type domain-containing protein n=1 Tax=Byssothecium circinans TaxID=147558 RepID=A0A6A5THK9_9PLEO|nr:hypothetical protein CC80DRAFT_242825 [Byssothecium circinans]